MRIRMWWAPHVPTVKTVAFYLPQFYPIPENDKAWGKGFTEWTNVMRARPLFKNHNQPQFPQPLNYYDLRDPLTRELQANQARQSGIFGFCYYYYWFNGKRLLSQPLDEVLRLARPNFPFCICWANESWTRRWNGEDKRIIIQQSYSKNFAERFINDITPILHDERYIRVDDRPLILVYRVNQIPNPARVAEIWRQNCRTNGIGEIMLATFDSFRIGDPRPFGFDVSVEFPPHPFPKETLFSETIDGLDKTFKGHIFSYEKYVKYALARHTSYPRFRGIMTGWDNTPRRGVDSSIFYGSSPTIYREWLKQLVRRAPKDAAPYSPFIFVNAWNEWGEGAILEPEQKYGAAYLRATAEILGSLKQS